MPAPFRTQRFVEFAETDMAGIAHFSSFFLYMEAAEHALIRSLGFSVHMKDADGAISFPRVSVACDYLSPVKCEDTLDIDVEVERLGDKSITYLFHFTRDGRPIAEGKTTCVCCRIRPDQPPQGIRIPDWIRERFAKIMA